MPPISFTVNGKRETVNVTPDTPVLWVLRDTLGLTGTKFGCGIAQCGACTVHLDGVATRTCVLPVAAVAGKRVTTIEGLSKNRAHAVQRAWIEEDVPQCRGRSWRPRRCSRKLRIPPTPTSTRP